MTCSTAIRASLCLGLLATVLGGHSSAQVLSHQKISDTQGGFTGTLDDVDTFGNGAAPVATTALAGLAFLSGGHIPGRSPYGEKVAKAASELVEDCRIDCFYCR